MGEQNVGEDLDARQLRSFMECLLDDIQALEQMLTEGRIESGVQRIGAEQELFLISSAWRPAPVAMEVLSRIDDAHCTTELGRFNLEINLDPLAFDEDSLARMEGQLVELLTKVRAAAAQHGAEVMLTGILPTLRKSDLDLSNMTPKPRYHALDRALHRLRGGDCECRITGPDELIVKHDSMMLEACCTSFQIHYQVSPREFVPLYNWAQVITAPLLAAATNSPLLFGRRLWKETRIPVFQQTVDTRNASYHLRECRPRVSFGQRWVENSVLDLFQEDIARFRILLRAPLDEDPLALLRQGLVPELKALRIHNSTVYRWNRPCYGVLDGQPHLRIENRVLPAGPTVLDEMANATFFFGLMSGLPLVGEDVARVMEFGQAVANFTVAARLGLEAQFTWLGGKRITATELISRELLPLAREGLRRASLRPADIDRYLGVIEERVSSGQTGSQWLLNSLSAMKKETAKDCEALSSLTAAAARHPWEGRPVHEWLPVTPPDESRVTKPSELRVEEFMTTDLITVDPEEPVDLISHLMDWKHIRHVPVEDEQGRLVGLISCFELLHQFGCPRRQGPSEPLAVGAIMKQDPITVAPETPALEAIARMRREKVDCLPVVKDGRLVGIVTERDLIQLAARLLEEKR